MKCLKYLVLVLTAFAGCAGYSQKTTDVISIEFTSLTRGYNKQVLITGDTLALTGNVGRGSESKTKKIKLAVGEWNKLVATLDGVALSEIPDLKSPTMKRAHDGAKHSTITITTKGTVVSHSFDDEVPHERLQKLMKAISRLAKSLE